MANTLRQRRINRILADIPLNPMVVRRCILVFRKLATLQLILMRRVPRTDNHLTAATHSLGIRGHHTDGSGVVEHVFGGDGFRADTAVGEGDVFGDVLGQVVAGHYHVEVFVDCVAGVWFRWVGTTGEDVDVFDQGDHIGGVTTAGAFDVVCVDGATLEGCCGSLDEAGFVQGVTVDLALDVVILADTRLISTDELDSRCMVDTYLRHVSMADGVQLQSSCNLRPATPALAWSWRPGFPVSLPLPITP